MTKKRVRWIDICKFLSMILVIWLHFGAPGPIDRYVHLFHMPVFFFLSGLCLSTNKSIGLFAKQRVRGLLIPYISFGVVFYLIWTCIHEVVLPDRIIDITTFLSHILWNNTDAQKYLWGGIQWFLTALFFAEMIVFLLSSLSHDKKKIMLIFAVGIPLTAMYALPKTGVRLPFAIDTALVAVAFVGIGYCLQENVLRIEKMKSSALCAFAGGAFAVSALVYCINDNVNMRLMQYGNPLLFLVGSLSGSIMMICISVLVLRAFDSVLQHNPIKHALGYILYLGRNTIILLYIHRLFDGLNKTILYLCGISFGSPIVSCVYYAVMVIVFIFVSYPITRFIDNRCGFLVGRWGAVADKFTGNA